MCSALFHFSRVAAFTDNFLILGIACHRAWILLRPLRPPPELLSKVYIRATWVVSVMYHATIMHFETKIYYEPHLFGCASKLNWRFSSIYMLSLARGFVPVVMTVIASVVILRVVFTLKPMPGFHQDYRKPVFLVLSICVIYVLAWVPGVLYEVVRVEGYRLWYEQWGCSLELLLVLCHLVFNPLVYTLTNRRFRHFVLGTLY